MHYIAFEMLSSVSPRPSCHLTKYPPCFHIFVVSVQIASLIMNKSQLPFPNNRLNPPVPGLADHLPVINAHHAGVQQVLALPAVEAGPVVNSTKDKHFLCKVNSFLAFYTFWRLVNHRGNLIQNMDKISLVWSELCSEF